VDTGGDYSTSRKCTVQNAKSVIAIKSNKFALVYENYNTIVKHQLYLVSSVTDPSSRSTQLYKTLLYNFMLPDGEPVRPKQVGVGVL
jgi:hypothetical protein